jgi:hypothetical protein
VAVVPVGAVVSDGVGWPGAVVSVGATVDSSCGSVVSVLVGSPVAIPVGSPLAVVAAVVGVGSVLSLDSGPLQASSSDSRITPAAT